jgi:hypothetical protein
MEPINRVLWYTNLGKGAPFPKLVYHSTLLIGSM